jgi:hypothetical protein
MTIAHDDGLLFEIHRVAVMPDAPKGASSMLIQAMRRAAGALGYNRATTTTLASESGASLRGAGWKQTTFLEPRGGWDCKARARKPGPCDRVAKLRWEVVINAETHSPNHKTSGPAATTNQREIPDTGSAESPC